MNTIVFVLLYMAGALGLSLLIFSASLRDRIARGGRLLFNQIIQKASSARYTLLSKSKKKAITASDPLSQRGRRADRITGEEDDSPHILPFWYGDHKKYLLLSGAVVMLVITPVIWVASQNRHGSLKIEDLNNNYADVENAQIHALLVGEQLKPPAPPPEELFDQLQSELASMGSSPAPAIPAPAIPSKPFSALEQLSPFNRDRPASNDETAVETRAVAEIKTADRKWDRMNSQYVQRLLVVFKLMKEKYGYDMVLLEGYRSPDRQNRLAAMGSSVTKATGFKSYHQFGLAADCAFLRNGKIVISERDPWAMEGYRKYGELAESVGLTWGGRWKMMDLGHTELRIRGILGNPEIARKMTSGTTGIPTSTAEESLN